MRATAVGCTFTPVAPAIARIVAEQDPGLSARVVRCAPLVYAEGADEREDRPAHVRAASAIVPLGGSLAIVQDDASWIALVEPGGNGAARAVALPRGEGGLRVFGDERGNKAHKLDLEACVSFDEGRALVAFGSGSTAARERVVIVRTDATGAPEVSVVHARALYARLRDEHAFSGSELNVEGAVLLPDGVLRLFNRGNGAPRDGRAPIDATVDLAWDDVRAYLERGGGGDPPALERIVQYDLGAIGGIRLTFTDAALAPRGDVVFLAAAEDSPDATRDGAVVGAAIGFIDGDRRARWTSIVGAGGDAMIAKPEGVALDPHDPHRAIVVIDVDRHDVPSGICDLRLDGAW